LLNGRNRSRISLLSIAGSILESFFAELVYEEGHLVSLELGDEDFTDDDMPSDRTVQGRFSADFSIGGICR